MTLQEWTEWKNLPQSKEWFEFLKLTVEEAKDLWLSQFGIEDTEFKSSYTNAYMLGGANAVKKLVEISYEEFIEERNDLGN